LLLTHIAATEKRFIVRADEKLTPFVELESATRKRLAADSLPLLNAGDRDAGESVRDWSRGNRSTLWLFEIALVLVRLDHVAYFTE
jgi:hypothetical protein